MKKAASTALVLLALGQLVVLLGGSWREAPERPRPEPLRLGDQFATLDGQMDGKAVQIALRRPDNRWTAVLAFASTCVHCDAVAPVWSSWLRQEHAFDVVGITRDSASVAAEYSREHGWPLRILNVERGDPRTDVFVSRTPWVFLFDEHGVMRYEGHGSTVGAMDSVMRVQGGLSPAPE